MGRFHTLKERTPSTSFSFCAIALPQLGTPIFTVPAILKRLGNLTDSDSKCQATFSASKKSFQPSSQQMAIYCASTAYGYLIARMILGLC